MFPLGDHNHITDLTIARNTASENGAQGILVYGGFGEADENTLSVRIRDNTVTDNGAPGIRVLGGADNSSGNKVVVGIERNTLERNPVGIVTRGGFGAESGSTGDSEQNVVNVRIERNTLKTHGIGISVFGGSESVAHNNQVTATVRRNVVEGSTVTGLELAAGGSGMASENTLQVQSVHNTVCGDGTDIVAEGGFSGSVILPVPNQGTGNVLEGEISRNTATEVIVANGTAGNTATVTQNNNTPCP